MAIFSTTKKSDLTDRPEHEDRYTVLVVDDERANLDALTRLLDGEYRVLAAADGSEALRIAEKESANGEIHVIIADQRMPGMSGVDLLRQTQQFFPRTIRMILTGYADVQDIIDSINKASIYRFILKPFEPDELLVTIRRAIEAYNLEAKNLQLLEKLRNITMNLEQKVAERTRELENTIRWIREDLTIARKIQSSIIPSEPISGHGIEIVPYYKPISEVGGDLIDITQIRDNYWRLFLADATGHGVQAALITMAIKVHYDALKRDIPSPDILLSKLNDRMMESVQGGYALFPCVLADVDIGQNQLIFSAAGHIDQLICKKDAVWHLHRTGRILGFDRGAGFTLRQIPVSAGDRIFLFSDGIPEQIDAKNEEYGYERLKQILNDISGKSMKSTVERIIRDVGDFGGSTGMMDDVALIGVEIRNDPGGPMV